MPTSLHQVPNKNQEHQHPKQKDNCTRPLLILAKTVPRQFIQPIKNHQSQMNRNLHSNSRKIQPRFRKPRKNNSPATGHHNQQSRNQQLIKKCKNFRGHKFLRNCETSAFMTSEQKFGAENGSENVSELTEGPFSEAQTVLCRYNLYR